VEIIDVATESGSIASQKNLEAELFLVEEYSQNAILVVSRKKDESLPEDLFLDLVDDYFISSLFYHTDRIIAMTLAPGGFENGRTTWIRVNTRVHCLLFWKGNTKRCETH
jgi:hypothetical protein